MLAELVTARHLSKGDLLLLVSHPGAGSARVRLAVRGPCRHCGEGTARNRLPGEASDLLQNSRLARFPLSLSQTWIKCY